MRVLQRVIINKRQEAMSVNLITLYPDPGLIETQSELPTRKRKRCDEQDYCECSSKRAALDKERIGTLEKQVRDQADEIRTLHEQFASIQDTLKQFTSTQKTLEQFVPMQEILKQQASEIASSKSQLNELQPTGVINQSSLSNPFMDLSEEELIMKLNIAKKKRRFFREKIVALGEDAYCELNRILEYVAVNAISVLSPGIITPGSVSDILKDKPCDYLESLLKAQLFGQCYQPYCINFILEGEKSKNKFLIFLHNTIQHTRQFKSLQSDLANRKVGMNGASQRLIAIICSYGLDELFTSMISTDVFDDTDISEEYGFNNDISERILYAEKHCKGYIDSFSLWPFNEFVPVAVDPEGFPGHYLTGLFINHFSNAYEPTRRLQIDDQEDVELELVKLQEALKSKQ